MRRDGDRHRLDHAMLDDHIHVTRFPTVAGELTFGKDRHPVPEHHRQRPVAVPRHNPPGDPVAGGMQDQIIYPYQDAKKKKQLLLQELT
jgi:hypothetical protein